LSSDTQNQTADILAFQAPADPLAALYLRYRRDIVEFVRRKFGPGPPEPEDVAQAVFLQLASHGDASLIQNPRSFLLKSAQNVVLDHHRRTQRQRESSGELERQARESYAVFGEVSRAFNDDRFNVTGGIRYFNDDVKSIQLSDFSGGPVAAPIPASFDRVTGRVVFNYRPQTNRMFYGSVATGFRSGVNQNFAVATAAPQLPALLPDSLITYELGAKGALFDGTFTYDTAVYYTEWKDIQQSLQLPGFGFNAYVNAGTASGAGLDASIVHQVNTRLRLQGAVGWSDLKLDEDIFSAGVPLFSKGDRINLSPEWTASVGANYRQPTPIANVELVVATSYGYRSELAFRYLASGGVSQTYSQTTTNLRASIRLAGERWSADLFGDNLSNELDATSPPNPLFAYDSVRQRPRTIGLQVGFKF
jgi:iron complex outermembrane receptor protein